MAEGRMRLRVVLKSAGRLGKVGILMVMVLMVMLMLMENLLCREGFLGPVVEGRLMRVRREVRVRIILLLLLLLLLLRLVLWCKVWVLVGSVFTFDAWRRVVGHRLDVCRLELLREQVMGSRRVGRVSIVGPG